MKTESEVNKTDFEGELTSPVRPELPFAFQL